MQIKKALILLLAGLALGICSCDSKNEAKVMTAKEIGHEEWTRRYNEREFNSPKRGNDDLDREFEEEFTDVCGSIEKFLNSEYPEIPEDEDFAVYVHPNHNWTRVVSAEVTDPAAFSKSNALRLQQHISALPNGWMVILDCLGSTLFVTPSEITAYLPLRDEWEGVDLSWIKANN